jgi:hypothetical protein
MDHSNDENLGNIDGRYWCISKLFGLELRAKFAIEPVFAGSSAEALILSEDSLRRPAIESSLLIF